MFKTIAILPLATAVLLGVAADAQTLRSSEGEAPLGLKAVTGPFTEINCNPSTSLKPYTCKCDTSGGCTLLGILCEHVDGPYYQCDEDHSTSDAAAVRRRLSN